MQALTSIEDSKYGHCHLVDDVSLKQPHSTQQYAASSITLGGAGSSCHQQPGGGGLGGSEVAGDNMTTVIKSEDGVSHSYVLPPFMH